jgi:glucose/arabinose dehydrogenase
VQSSRFVHTFRVPVRRLILVSAAACLLAFGLLATRTSAVSLSLQPVFKGLRQPLDVRAAPDGSGRLFIVEKAGIIRVAHGGQLSDRPFLDLRGVVGARGSEQGLLGLVFHPRYVENGFFYVNYTDGNGDSVVARYQVSGDPDVADPDTGAVIMFQPQPFPNHNAGNLVFGPDGFLWIAWGDGGSAGDPRGNAQNGGTWLGKMLRIDVDGGFPYTIPPDNPFASSPDVLPEIWAFGLRNPWRYSFDRATGDLYIGDVGQGAWEEVDMVPAGTPGGVNFGWNRTEGNHCFNSRNCDLGAFAPAVAEYGHDRGDCAVVGGFVYRGSAFPALVGTYVYADECTGRVWSLAPDEAGNWNATEQLSTGINLSGFGEDEAGEMYVTGLSDGTLYRVAGE